MSYGIAQFPRLAVCVCLVIPWLTGCAAFYPLDGIPARYIPDEIKYGPPKAKQIIDFSLLEQQWDGIHRVDSGDLLAIYIGGILGKIDENPQVQIPANPDYQPAAGVPVTVREDGTISLPIVGAIQIRGMTLRQTEETVRLAYTDHAVGREYLKPGRERILVSLQRPRQTHVMVIRQDSRTEPMQNSAVGTLNLGTAKRGSGKLVHLPAYRNDVLNALIATDGLPGTDAENAVYIIRRMPGGPAVDPLWGSDCDPESLIRKGKELSQPKIRGQNPSDSYEGGGNSVPSGAIYIDRAPRRTKSAASSSRSLALPQSAPPAADENEWNYGSPRSNVRKNQTPFPATSSKNANPFGGNSFGSGQTNSSWRNEKESLVPPVNDELYQDTRPISRREKYEQEAFEQRASQVQSTNRGWNERYPSEAASMSSYDDGRDYDSGEVQQVGVTPTNHMIPTSPPMGGHSAPYSYSNGASIPPSPVGNVVGHTYPELFSNSPDEVVDPQGVPLDPSTPVQYDHEFDTDGVAMVNGRRIIRIPIRLVPGERVNIRKEDVILHDGDIVFIESRDSEVFFTGGLLGGGQYTLPRDTELNIQNALSIATSRSTGAAARQLGGVSALNGDVTISPSTAVVIRKMPDGTELPIKVNLYRARTDLSERINILPGDYVYLQYTPLEAVGAFIDRHLLEGALFGLVGTQLTTNNGNR